MVADEFDQDGKTELGQAINQILNQGFQRRRPIIKCDGDKNEPRAFQCFGPKLLALRGRLGDDASESRTISIRMVQRTRADIPINLPREKFDREALALRNRLLWWRFTNLGEVRIDPTLADAGLQDRANQIALPLLSVARTSEARATIIAALKAQQLDAAADSADSLAGEVFHAILSMLTNGSDLRPRDVAAAVNSERAESAGVAVEKLGRRLLSSQRAGGVLRALELERAGRDKRGAYYVLGGKRLRQLCERFGEDIPRVCGNLLGAALSNVTNVTTSPPTSPEKPRSKAVRADGDEGDVGDVPGEPPGKVTTTPPKVTESAPEDDPDDEWGEV